MPSYNDIQTWLAGCGTTDTPVASNTNTPWLGLTENIVDASSTDYIKLLNHYRSLCPKSTPLYECIPLSESRCYHFNNYISYHIEYLKGYNRHADQSDHDELRARCFENEIKTLTESLERKMSIASPTTKQRLPSPPPFTEVQIGPRSPGVGASVEAPHHEVDNTDNQEDGAVRRIRPGTKAEDMASGPPLKPLTEVESAFQLQEHLKSLFHEHTRPSTSDHTTQLTHDTALTIANPPTGADRALWLYELCRLLVIKVDQLIVEFFNDSPPCSAQTCPEMRASEWQYLCAVHEPPKPCCAIDYCCHTLDWAATTLASQKHFPSRLTLGSDATGGIQAGVRQLTNIMRRVYRIFAHAWFQHRSVFWKVEGKEGLYMLFKTVCDVYNLIPEENYTIPPEAEGLAANEDERREGKAVLRDQGNEDTSKNETDTNTTTTASSTSATATTISTGATTRRHKTTPSFSSTVMAIAEGDEDEPKEEVEGGEEESAEPDSHPSTSSSSTDPTSQSGEADFDPLNMQQPHPPLPQAPVMGIIHAGDSDELSSMRLDPPESHHSELSLTEGSLSLEEGEQELEGHEEEGEGAEN